MENQESNSKHCISYAPGHNVHWLQAKVKRSEERLDAQIELLTNNALLVTYQNQTKKLSASQLRSSLRSEKKSSFLFSAIRKSYRRL
jgi:hypothetical protein